MSIPIANETGGRWRQIAATHLAISAVCTHALLLVTCLALWALAGIGQPVIPRATAQLVDLDKLARIGPTELEAAASEYLGDLARSAREESGWTKARGDSATGLDIPAAVRGGRRTWPLGRVELSTAPAHWIERYWVFDLASGDASGMLTSRGRDSVLVRAPRLLSECEALWNLRPVVHYALASWTEHHVVLPDNSLGRGTKCVLQFDGETGVLVDEATLRPVRGVECGTARLPWRRHLRERLGIDARDAAFEDAFAEVLALAQERIALTAGVPGIPDVAGETRLDELILHAKEHALSEESIESARIHTPRDVLRYWGPIVVLALQLTLLLHLRALRRNRRRAPDSKTVTGRIGTDHGPWARHARDVSCVWFPAATALILPRLEGAGAPVGPLAVSLLFGTMFEAILAIALWDECRSL